MKFYKIQRILSRYTGSQRYFLLDTNFPIKQSSGMKIIFNQQVFRFL